jgi:hypothetical protein
VKVPKNPSRGLLVKLVSQTIPKSPKFTVFLAEEILGKGRAPRQYLNTSGVDDMPTGGQSGGGSGTDWGSVDWAGMTQSTLSLVQSLGGLFGKDKPKPGVQQQLNGQTNTVHYIANPMSTTTKVLIGFAIAVPVIIAGVLVVKQLNK